MAEKALRKLRKLDKAGVEFEAIEVKEIYRAALSLDHIGHVISQEVAEAEQSETVSSHSTLYYTGPDGRIVKVNR